MTIRDEMRQRLRHRPGEAHQPLGEGVPGPGEAGEAVGESGDADGMQRREAAEVEAGTIPAESDQGPASKARGRRKFLPPAVLIAKIEAKQREQHADWIGTPADPFIASPPSDGIIAALWTARRTLLSLEQDLEIRRERLAIDYRTQLGQARQRIGTAEDKVAAAEQAKWNSITTAAREAGLTPERLAQLIAQEAPARG